MNFAQDDMDTSVLEFPDKIAEFPGGMVALQRYITENIKYPEEYGTIDIEGRIYFSFVVERDGSITNVKLLRGIDPKLNKMARELLLGMPKWNPAEHQGKKVRSYYRIPVHIHWQ